MKKTLLFFSSLLLVLLHVSCAVPYDPPHPSPSSSPSYGALVSEQTEFETMSMKDAVELQTFPIQEQITKFKVLTEEEKTEQIRLRYTPSIQPLPIVEWTKVAKKCPYTTDEILSLIAVGDELEKVYEKIGYPTYRDCLTIQNGLTTLNRPIDYTFMYYETADGGIVWIQPMLSGSSENEYQYVIIKISYAYHIGNEADESFSMNYDTLVAREVIPVFVAVEQKGVDYLLENDLITPYEATLYAAEEAVFQASLAAKEVQEQANE